MLSQDQVNDLACQFLEENGWTVTHRRRAHHPGKETVAERDGKRLIVAPHGEGSSRPGTSRFGKPFTRSQVFNHVSNLTTRLLRKVSENRTYGALAVPYDDLNRDAVGSMLDQLKRVGIGALWVTREGVTPDLPLDL